MSQGAQSSVDILLLVVPFGLLLSGAALNSAWSAALLSALWLAPQAGAPKPNLTYQHEPVSLVFSAQVVDSLSSLYRQYAPDEFLACLQGTVQRGVLVIDDFKLPPQKRVLLNTTIGQQIRALRIDSRACEQFGSTVTIHSHPASGRDDFCYVGPQDTATFSWRTSDTHMAIICARGIIWWRRDQVEGGNSAYPIEGQVVPFSLDGSVGVKHEN